ncbi:MAG: lasso peptide biosynthesis B2 protein [Desulfobaccales bacterium]
MDYWNSTKINLKKAWQLSGAERWLLVQASLALPLVALGLRCWGLCRLQARLNQGEALAPHLSALKSDLDQARATARLVQVAARYGLFRPTCLPRSLVLWWLLRRQGLAGELRIGVKPEPSRLEAHAWVEFQGQPLNDGANVAGRFPPFPREIIPPAAP